MEVSNQPVLTGEQLAMMQAMAQALGVKNPDNDKLTPHFTRGELAIRHKQQIMGEIPMMAANLDPSKQIKAHNAPYIHLTWEIMRFDEKDGRKLSKEEYKMFDIPTFERMVKTNAFNGVTVTIYHDPRRTNILNPKPPKPVVVNVVKDYTVMKKAELQEYYKELFGMDAPEQINVGELRATIKEKLEFLKDEELN